MAYKKEDRFEIRYISKKTGKEKRCVCIGKENRDKNLGICRDNELKVLSVKKLYPFNTYKNQHNFELIRNICFNTRYDMDSGEIPMDKAEYERLGKLEEKADRFFCLELPLAWLPWEDWKEANELAQMAIMHRQNACIANGRPDLVTYC